jgi:Flp pilus assembly pilin Flp
MLRQLWIDQRGVALSAELVLVMTIVILGALVGLATFRDSLTSEFADSGAAVGSLDQSYSYNEIVINETFDTIQVDATVAGSSYADASDFCEEGLTEGDPGNDVAGEFALCIVTASSINEGEAAPTPAP